VTQEDYVYYFTWNQCGWYEVNSGHSGQWVEMLAGIGYDYADGADNFWIKQGTQSSFPTLTEVYGKVVVASCSKASNISVHFKIAASDDRLAKKVTITPKHDGIWFAADIASLVRQHINVTAFVVIPHSHKYSLNKLRLSTHELDIHFAPSFTTAINSTYASTVSGSIRAHGTGSNVLDSKHLLARSTIGNISGEYPLEYDLALETTSGNINVTVNSERLKETIGHFRTMTLSGNTTAEFSSHLHPRPLYSKHKSVSGSVHLYYPVDWQGGLTIETTSGEIDVYGEGTMVVRKEKGVTGKLWEVVKGYGKSKGSISTVSGAIDVGIGKI